MLSRTAGSGRFALTFCLPGFLFFLLNCFSIMFCRCIHDILNYLLTCGAGRAAMQASSHGLLYAGFFPLLSQTLVG